MSTPKKEDRFADSASKIKAPFAVDPTMLFYSPQENVAAFEHPRIARYLEWISNDWTPPKGGPRIAILIPCTKYKPYPVSREHRSINGALLAAGWEPDGSGKPPSELYDALDDGEDERLLDLGTMTRNDVSLDRIVMSEPLGLVPYTHVYHWDDGPSPATSYDDPGLFGSRGSSVSPWRADHTATQTPSGKWSWGPNEREAYVSAHNLLSGVINQALTRVAPRYAAIGAWASPGLTHRSFLMDVAQRKDEGLPLSRRGPNGPMALAGVRDQSPDVVDIMPTTKQLEQAQAALAKRLKREGRSHTPGAVRAVYARGDGTDTPLGLPELLAHLIKWIDTSAKSAA